MQFLDKILPVQWMLPGKGKSSGYLSEINFKYLKLLLWY